LNSNKLDFLFRVLSELRFFKDVYIFKSNHFKKPLGKRGLSENIYIFKKQFTSTHRSGSADRECSGRTHLP